MKPALSVCGKQKLNHPSSLLLESQLRNTSPKLLQCPLVELRCGRSQIQRGANNVAAMPQCSREYREGLRLLSCGSVGELELGDPSEVLFWADLNTYLFEINTTAQPVLLLAAC